MREVADAPMGPTPLSFTVVRVPFFLEPDYPLDESFEEPNRTRLLRKWGGAAGWEQQKLHHRLKERGQAVGIEKFDLDRPASNTLHSHRLVQWATKTHGVAVSEALYDELNTRHFEKGQKLNSQSMLLDAAEAVGIDAEAAELFLESSEGYTEIEEVQATLRALRINSIPTFIVGGETVVGGAAHARDFVEVFRQIEARGGGAPRAAFADALGIPPTVLEQTL